ncbi:MAG: transglutaminase domain-containing protein [Candidatus Thermoplasmatota archaeon]|nr:transglutaminase domain-containing protein [Candidatus Thermoplasmatota archaeon]
MRMKVLILLLAIIMVTPVHLSRMSEGYDPPVRGDFDPNDPGGADLDTDGDGLSNREEAALGTNPDKADSDNDGMPDGFEAYFGLDPLSSTGNNGSGGNPDGDGWTNIKEYNYTSPDGLYRGTDPLDPNTDDDEYEDDATDPLPLDPYNGRSADTVIFNVNSTGPRVRFRTSVYEVYNGLGAGEMWSTGEMDIEPYRDGIIWASIDQPNSSHVYNLTFDPVVGSDLTSDLLPFIDTDHPFIPLPLNTERITTSDPPSSMGLDDRSLTAHNVNSGFDVRSFEMIIRRYQVPVDRMERENSTLIGGNLTSVPRYLQKNGTFHEVFDLALEITDGQVSGYGKAAALSEFLNERYAYSDNPMPAPAGRDQIYWMTIGQRVEGGFDPNSTGYGDLRYGEGNSITFASSLVIMCRLLNISARLVVGYDSSEENQWSSGWVFRGRHMKAWAECYFTGLGWIEFDPTPGKPPASDVDPPDKELDEDADGIPDYIEVGDGFLSTDPWDHDNDGIIDFLDPDDDDDGIEDIEDQQPFDHDNDGLDDGADPDDDNDGGPDHEVFDIDTDDDTIPDNLDDDRDGDGVTDISDVSEGGTLPWGDPTSEPVHWRNITDDLDKDGILNEADRDQDGDGIFDAFDMDDDNDGVLDPDDVDDDNDGTPDSLDLDINNDLDDDQIPNEEDSDDDGDWIDDDLDPDDDNDGIWDWFDPDDDNDGIPDIKERSWGGTPYPDQDGDLDDDGIPNEEDPDLDDGSGRRRDDDNDGIINIMDTDDDNDGIADPFDLDTDNDLDNDGIVNELDPDMDNDTFLNGVDQDDDNDGIPDVYDQDRDNDGNGNQPGETSDQDLYPFDHDNDGIPDLMDDDKDGDGRTDSDGDGKEDVGTSDHDHDDDGTPDDEDKDDDEDGVTDLDEMDLFPRLMRTNSTNPWDHDNDGVPDDEDPDDDDDAREEDDADGDREEEGFSTSDWDSDNDGILDRDDKIPTRVSVEAPNITYLGEKVEVTGSIILTDGSPGSKLIVSVHINYTIRNNTGAVIFSEKAISSNPIQADSRGNFSLFMYPFYPNLDVGPNTTYSVIAEVHDLFYYKGSWSSPSPLEIRSRTSITIIAPGSIISGEEPLRLKGSIGYKGSTRGVSSANLTISFLGRDHPFVRSNATGKLDLQYDPSADMFRYYAGNDRNATIDVGDHEVSISYRPDVLDTSMEYQKYLDPASVTVSIRVLHRTSITANVTLLNGTIREMGVEGFIEVVVGSSILIRGTSNESWAGAKNPLVLKIGKRELTVVQPLSDGRFAASVFFDPSNFEAGEEVLSLSYIKKEFFLPVNTISIPVRTIGIPALTNVNSGKVYRGEEALISGRLISNVGKGIPFQRISIVWSDIYQFYTDTDSGGWFTGYYMIPRDHEMGSVHVDLSYTGSDIYLPTGSNTTFQVVSGSMVEVAYHTSVVMRGENADPFILRGRLTDDNSTPEDDIGQPLGGMMVHLIEDRTIIATESTDSTGIFMFSFNMPVTQALGNHTYQIIFNGSDGYLQGRSDEVHTAVISATFMSIKDCEVVLDTGIDDDRFDPKSFRITGKLTDDVGEGVFLADVAISIEGLGLSTIVQTDSFGGFSNRFTINEHVLGNFILNGSFPGTPYRYLPSYARSNITISTFSILDMELPEFQKRNSSYQISGRLRTAGGSNLPDSDIIIGTGIEVLCSIRSNSEGIFSFDMDIPLTRDVGTMRLWASYSGTEFIVGLNSTRSVDVKATTVIVPIDVPVSGASSSTVKVIFRLVLDNGSSMVEKEVAVEMEGGIVSTITNDTGIAVIEIPPMNDTSLNRSYRAMFNGTRFYLPSEYEFRMDRIKPQRIDRDSYLLESLITSIIAIALLVLGVFAVLRKRLIKARVSKEERRTVPRQMIHPRSRNVAEVFKAYREYSRSMKGLGVPMSEYNTVREDDERARSKGIAANTRKKMGLLDIFEVARYSLLDIPDEMVVTAQNDARSAADLLRVREGEDR